MVSPGMPGSLPQMPGPPTVGKSVMAQPVNQGSAVASLPNKPAAMSVERPPVVSPTLQTGVDFASSKGARGATVAGAIQGISQLVSDMQQKRDEKTRVTAENLYSRLMTAQATLMSNPEDSNARAVIETMLDQNTSEGKKNVKLLEKSMPGLLSMMNGQGATPEEQGATRAVGKAKQAEARGGVNQPGGVRFPMPQSSPQQQLQSALAQHILKQAQDPKQGNAVMNTLAWGTPMDPVEQYVAEKYKSGLEISPKDKELFRQNGLETTLNAAIKIVGIDQDMKQFQQTIQQQRDKLDFDKDSDRRWFYAQSARWKEMGEITKKIHEAKQKQNYTKMDELTANLYGQFIKNNTSLAEKYRKDGNEDKAKELEAANESYKQKIEDLHAEAEMGGFDLDNFMKDMMAPPPKK